MTGLIIAAGRGSRLAGNGNIKPLIPVGGIPLIEHVIRGAVGCDCDSIFVITGHEASRLETFLDSLSDRINIPIHALYNPEWELDNGRSVLQAKTRINDRFFLLMCDHLFDPTILGDLKSMNIPKADLILAVDENTTDHPMVDLEDVTRVLFEKDHIIDIGKGLTRFNAFDTGLFLATPGLFDALEESQNRGDFSPPEVLRHWRGPAGHSPCPFKSGSGLMWTTEPP